ncbi:18332_t:CDS:2, partial [Funneliformis geosporum]
NQELERIKKISDLEEQVEDANQLYQICDNVYCLLAPSIPDDGVSRSGYCGLNELRMCGNYRQGNNWQRTDKSDNKKFCSEECFNNHYAEKCDKCQQKVLGQTYYNDIANKAGILCSSCHQKREEEERKETEILLQGIKKKILDAYNTLQKEAEQELSVSFFEIFDLSLLKEKELASELETYVEQIKKEIKKIRETKLVSDKGDKNIPKQFNSSSLDNTGQNFSNCLSHYDDSTSYNLLTEYRFVYDKDINDDVVGSICCDKIQCASSDSCISTDNSNFFYCKRISQNLFCYSASSDEGGNCGGIVGDDEIAINTTSLGTCIEDLNTVADYLTTVNTYDSANGGFAQPFLTPLGIINPPFVPKVPQNPLIKIIIPIGATAAGVVSLAGITCYVVYQKNRKREYNDNIVLIISERNRVIRDSDYCLWLVTYDSSFEKFEENINLIKVIKKISKVRENWKKIIEDFKDTLENSDHPAAEIHNNVYTSNLPTLSQNYKNIVRTTKKLSSKDNPNNYIKPYDIIKVNRKSGLYQHAAIYLGEGKVAHVNNPEGKVEIHHPFIPFKKPELIQKHIDIAVKVKYGEGKYHLLKDNCEHFATMCVYGLGMSRQRLSTINSITRKSDYLLQAIKESNEFFENLENNKEVITDLYNSKEQAIIF